MQPFRSDRVLGFAALGFLIVGCFLVLRPFLSAVLWAAILATTVWPVFRWVDQRLPGWRNTSALLTTLATALVLVAPFVVVAVGLGSNVAELAAATRTLLEGGLPDAPQWLRDIPFVGERLHAYWQGFAHNGQRLVAELGQLVEPAKGLVLNGSRAIGMGVFHLMLSVLIVFFLFRDGESVTAHLAAVLERLAGARGRRLLHLAHGTVGGVVYGIIGTALAQGVLAGIGFAVAGVPGALLLGLATFFLSAVPVGPPLIWGPAAFWLFQQGLLRRQHRGQRAQAPHHQPRRQPALHPGAAGGARRRAGLRLHRRLPRSHPAGRGLPADDRMDFGPGGRHAPGMKNGGLKAAVSG